MEAWVFFLEVESVSRRDMEDCGKSFWSISWIFWIPEPTNEIF